MLIVLHVISALSSLTVTSLAVVKPSAYALRFGVGLTALTTLSGTILIVQNHAHLVSACVSGLTYLGFAVSGLLVSRWRLAHAAVKIRNK